MSCLPVGRHCSRLTERGCHVACALIGILSEMSLRYGESQSGCIAATRGAVAPRIYRNFITHNATVGLAQARPNNV